MKISKKVLFANKLPLFHPCNFVCPVCGGNLVLWKQSINKLNATVREGISDTFQFSCGLYLNRNLETASANESYVFKINGNSELDYTVVEECSNAMQIALSLTEVKQ